MERRLAAILLTDMVGYSRLMGLDEEGTIARQKAHRDEVIDPQISSHGGRIVKTTGDGLLVEFPSVVDSVKCAIDVQNQMARRDIDLPEDRRIQYRIGVNLGDIVIDGDDIVGDGVNVAARLEAMAQPGCVCISNAVYDQVRDRVEIDFTDLGERDLKNIERPVRVWQWRGNAVVSAQTPTTENPSIAVLAFENMSSDPEHTFFGDGLAEDIITILSKISSLIVIARNSSFAYKGRAVDLRTVGRELGVKYVLEGSVRAASGGLRVNAQLTDASTGSHIWAERYDRKLEDIFAIQDEITREIVTALRTQLSDGEETQLWLRGTGNIEAWSAVMAAHDRIFNSTAKDSLAAADTHLRRAIAHDPEYAAAYASIGQVIWFQLRYGFVEDRVRAIEELGAAATRAAALEPNNALAQMVLAGHAQLSGDDERAFELGRRAIELSPNNAFMRIAFGRILIFLGRPNDAEEHLRLAMRLNPYGPVVQYGILANALERQGKDEEAIAVLREATSKHSDYLAGHLRLASMLGLSGVTSEAAHHIAEAQRLRPNLDRKAVEAFYGNDDPPALSRFLDGLVRAGLLF